MRLMASVIRRADPWERIVCPDHVPAGGGFGEQVAQGLWHEDHRTVIAAAVFQPGRRPWPLRHEADREGGK